MRRQRRPLLPLGLVLPAVLLIAGCDEGSRVLGDWKQTAILQDGRPIGPPMAPKGVMVTSSQKHVQIKVSGHTLSLNSQMIMAFPGAAPTILASESLLFDLRKPVKQRLMQDGPEYDTFVSLSRKMLIIRYQDPTSGVTVVEDRWVLADDGRTLQNMRGKSGGNTKSCLVTVPTQPGQTIPNNLPPASECRSGEIVRVFERS